MVAWVKGDSDWGPASPLDSAGSSWVDQEAAHCPGGEGWETVDAGVSYFLKMILFSFILIFDWWIWIDINWKGREGDDNSCWRVQYSELMDDQALFLKSTLISTPLGTTMEVTSLSWEEVHSRSIYLLKTVISQLSQVLEPSPQGVLLQQILRCLLGILTGPLSLI